MKFETFEFVRPEDAFTMYLIAISICKEEVYRALSMPRKAWLGTPGGNAAGSPALASRSPLAASESLKRLYFPDKLYQVSFYKISISKLHIVIYLIIIIIIVCEQIFTV